MGELPTKNNLHQEAGAHQGNGDVGIDRVSINTDDDGFERWQSLVTWLAVEENSEKKPVASTSAV
jgi:hypothetical protein